MNVNYLAETAITQIQTLIKSQIGASLAALRTDRGDSKVSTEVPQEYFIYDEAKALKTPAIFTIARGIDFQKQKYNANMTTAKIDVGVSVLVEDKDKYKLTVKTWRYQDALFSILDQARIDLPVQNVTLFLIVTNANFSPTWAKTQSQGPSSVFRKEVALTVEVQQRESL